MTEVEELKASLKVLEALVDDATAQMSAARNIESKLSSARWNVQTARDKVFAKIEGIKDRILRIILSR